MSDKVNALTADFDLGHVPASRRSKAWADELNDNFYGYDVNCASIDHAASYKGIMTDTLKAATLTSDPMSIHRRTAHIGRDGVDAFFMIAPFAGDFLIQQRGRESRPHKGEFTFGKTAEPFSFYQNARREYFTIVMPTELIRSRKPNADDYLAADFSRSGLNNIFTDFAGSFCQHMHTLSVETFRRTQDSVLDMLALVLEGGDVYSNETGVRMAHRRRILQEVERRFHHPGLNLPDIAAALGLSPRYVQQILAGHGETLSDLVRTRRIAEACQLLARREASRASIATIAYSVGYLDPAYFSRVFKRQVGVSPLDYTARNDQRPRFSAR